MSEHDFDDDDGRDDPVFTLPFDPMAQLSRMEQWEAKFMSLAERHGENMAAWPLNEWASLTLELRRFEAIGQANNQALLREQARLDRLGYPRADEPDQDA